MQNPLRSATLGLFLCVAAVTATASHAVELHPDVQEAERAFVANDLDATDAALKRRLAENPNDVEAIRPEISTSGVRSWPRRVLRPSSA